MFDFKPTLTPPHFVAAPFSKAPILQARHSPAFGPTTV